MIEHCPGCDGDHLPNDDTCDDCSGTGRKTVTAERSQGYDGVSEWGRKQACDCREGWRLSYEAEFARCLVLETQNEALQGKNDEMFTELEQLRAAGAGAGKFHSK